MKKISLFGAVSTGVGMLIAFNSAIDKTASIFAIQAMTIAITNGVPTALEPLADETKQLVAISIPTQLSIGNVELIDGRWVKGFLCEENAVKDAEDITSKKSF